MVTITLMALLGVSAIAIDLSAMRADRSADQKVTDSAAASGALATIDGSGRDACEAALAYVVVNSGEITSIDTSGCVGAFTLACNPDVAQSHTVPAGTRYTVTVTYPVPDDHPLMTSGLLGASGQALVDADGVPCQRVGVEMAAVHTSTFARVLGFEQGTTEVHTVARVGSPEGPGFPINLLVLNRTACDTVVASGNGGVIVDAVVNPDGVLEQGMIAADSDGTGTGCSTSGVFNVSGGGSIIRADGPAGCPTETGTELVPPGLLKGYGCGLIMTLAPGTPGCNKPACTTSGGGNEPNPPPTRLPSRLTRAPVDYLYNCQPDYTTLDSSLAWATAPLTTANGQDIPGCKETPAPHIHDLITEVGQTGPPLGFQSWTAAGYPCNLPSSYADIDVSGNWWINCSSGGGFSVNNQVTIRGNVVFDRDVSVGAQGSLAIVNTQSNPGYAFFRNGELKKAGGASLTFRYTMVYFSRTSTISLTGGSGALIWIAPQLENHKFDGLALWSDSPLLHSWAGQADLQMEGIFFSPRAKVNYSGSAGTQTTHAQWVTDKFEASGQGFLRVRPLYGRSLEFPVRPATILIR
jgi:hypothetical protein